MRAAAGVTDVCPTPQGRVGPAQRPHPRQGRAPSSVPRCRLVTRAAPPGEEVFACPLPSAAENEASSSTGTVYACALPEPKASSSSQNKVRWWQVWKRKKQEKVGQKLNSEEEIARLNLSSARWQQEKARLEVICEAYNAAELAEKFGDTETARILRERAALWAGTVTSGLPAGSGVGSIAASPALASSLSVAGAVDAPSAGVGLRDVVVEVRTLDSSNGREVWAATPVAAPPEMVWRTLTDYERLADIVPSLTENRIIERWNGGVRLVQIAAQEVGFGLKFSAAATLDIEEHPKGIPPEPGPGESAYASGSGGVRRVSRRIIPRSIGPPMGDVRDICFSLVESRDLKLFTGTWRIEGNAKSARLLYNVEVQPQPWLPIGLVVDRVAKDIKGNLTAVRDYAETLSQNAVVIERPTAGAS